MIKIIVAWGNKIVSKILRNKPVNPKTVLKYPFARSIHQNATVHNLFRLVFMPAWTNALFDIYCCTHHANGMNSCTILERKYMHF